MGKPTIAFRVINEKATQQLIDNYSTTMETSEYVKKQNTNDKATVLGCLGSIAAFIGITLLLLIVYGCETPRVISEQHYYYSETDTAAIESVVNGKMQSVREDVVKEVSAKLTQQQSEQNTQEQEKEKVTETITTWVDSLGRQMRQEQRTTERDISRQQQLREQRMQQEWQNRLQTTVDSVNRQWDKKFNMMKGRWEQLDSLSHHQEPAPGDNRPWYKRLWSAMKWMLIGGVIAAAIYLVIKFWNTFVKILP